jgi:hypothetical protein
MKAALITSAVVSAVCFNIADANAYFRRAPVSHCDETTSGGDWHKVQYCPFQEDSRFHKGLPGVLNGRDGIAVFHTFSCTDCEQPVKASIGYLHWSGMGITYTPQVTGRSDWDRIEVVIPPNWLSDASKRNYWVYSFFKTKKGTTLQGVEWFDYPL